MVAWNYITRRALQDPFRPPDEPIEVCCAHCGRTYLSSEMAWVVGEDGEGFWRCPGADCDGLGFGFDICPVHEEDWQPNEAAPPVQPPRR